MTTNLTTAEDRLATLGLPLPEAPTPCGVYMPVVQTGNLLVPHSHENSRNGCFHWMG